MNNNHGFQSKKQVMKRLKLLYILRNLFHVIQPLEKLHCTLVKEEWKGQITSWGLPQCLSSKKKKKKIHLQCRSCRRHRFSPWARKAPWKINPLQDSHLENPTDRGAWWATVPRVAKSRTWPKWRSTHAGMSSLDDSKGIEFLKVSDCQVRSFVIQSVLWLNNYPWYFL